MMAYARSAKAKARGGGVLLNSPSRIWPWSFLLLNCGMKQTLMCMCVCVGVHNLQYLCACEWQQEEGAQLEGGRHQR